MSPRWVDVGVLVLVLVTGLVVLFVAFLLWRDGYVRGWRAARATPPICPRCGYNLSGLTHCRCPECGVEYRLDQLWGTAILLKMRQRGDDAAVEPR